MSIQYEAKPDIKEIAYQEDFRKGTFVTIKQKYFSQPLHIESNRTNHIVCFDQPMKSENQIVCFAHTLNVLG